MLLKNGQLRNLLFIDIETVPQYSSHDQLPNEWQTLWNEKQQIYKNIEGSAAENYLNRAGIFSEFAKVVCISLGYFHYQRELRADVFRIKTFAAENEKQLLMDFAKLIHDYFDADKFQFCGHNIREFDIPFLCRRLMINHIPLPDMLDVSGKKPWELNDIDTLHLWRFGDHKNYTSLKLMAAALGIPSPKDEIEGKDICHEYWIKKNLEGIVHYCQKDVITVARLLMRFRNEPELLQEKDVIFVN